MPTTFEVHVVPRSSRPGPDGRHGGIPRLRIAAPPVAGRANREVEKVLGDLLGCAVRLEGGAKGRRKRLEADADARTLERRLRDVFGPAP